MIPKDFALYAMGLLGLGFGAAAITIMLRRPPTQPRSTIFLAVFAFAVLGVSAYGPSFFGDYSKFLRELASLEGPAQQQAYEKLVGDMASGKMPKEYRPLVEAYMLEHPTEDLHSVVEKAATEAGPDRKAELLRFQADLQRKHQSAELALKGAALASPAEAGAATKLESLDTGTLRALEQKPAEELRALKVDPRSLEMLIKSRGFH